MVPASITFHPAPSLAIFVSLYSAFRRSVRDGPGGVWPIDNHGKRATRIDIAVTAFVAQVDLVFMAISPLGKCLGGHQRDSLKQMTTRSPASYRRPTLRQLFLKPLVLKSLFIDLN